MRLVQTIAPTEALLGKRLTESLLVFRRIAEEVIHLELEVIGLELASPPFMP